MCVFVHAFHTSVSLLVSFCLHRESNINNSSFNVAFTVYDNTYMHSRCNFEKTKMRERRRERDRERERKRDQHYHRNKKIFSGLFRICVCVCVCLNP